MKKINEAAIRLDISNLESTDFETLSRILQLSGQAEMSSETPLEAPVSVSEPSLDMTNPMSLDLDINEPELLGNDFDVVDDTTSILSRSGLDETISSEAELDDLQLTETSQLLPDLSLEESPEQPSELHGSFGSESEAVQDAQHQTNGVENEHFIIVPRGNEYYWKRIMNEDMELYNTDGIMHSGEDTDDKCVVSTQGDNPLTSNVNEIFESLNKRYQEFLEN